MGVQLGALDWLMERDCCPMCPVAQETGADEMLAHALSEAAPEQTEGADATAAAAVANTAQLKFPHDDQVLHVPLCGRCTCRMCAMQVRDFDSVADCSCCPMCPAASLETAIIADDERLARTLSEAEAEQVGTSGDTAATEHDVPPSTRSAVAPEIHRQQPMAAASAPDQAAGAIAEVRRARAAAWHGQPRQATEAAAVVAASVPPPRQADTGATGVNFPQRRQNGLVHTGPFLLQGQRLHLTNGYITGPVNLEACEVFFQDVHITGPVCLQNSQVRMQGCRVIGPISLQRSALRFSSSMHVGPLNCDSGSSY